MKKIISGIILIINIVIIIVVVFTILGNKGKGGDDAYTAFDVETTSLTVSYKDKSYTFTGHDWESIIKELKKATSNEYEECKLNDFNIIIDFNNGNSGRLSESGNVFEYADSNYYIDKKIYNDIKAKVVNFKT